jgi:predicted ABC-type exoprotein transport system permease subunit
MRELSKYSAILGLFSAVVVFLFILPLIGEGGWSKVSLSASLLIPLMVFMAIFLSLTISSLILCERILKSRYPVLIYVLLPLLSFVIMCIILWSGFFMILPIAF